MSKIQSSQIDDDHTNDDEILFEMLKDQFSFFYALTVSVMDLLKSIKTDEDKDKTP
jgi:hypothetical protein